MHIPVRRLPHWRPEDRALFITWALNGSLPACRYPPPGNPSAGRAFVWMDRYLDTARTGPMWLRRPEIADIVVFEIRRAADAGFCELKAWVVMSNHVYLLVRPLIDVAQMMRTIKGRTAREANRLIGQTGKPFWQAESYDRWMRTTDEISKVTQYIENNPVVAGLAMRTEDYKWSSAWPGGAGFSLQPGL